MIFTTAEAFSAFALSTTWKVCVPSPSAAVAVQTQFPVPSTVTVPTFTPSTSTLSVESGVAVPRKPGRVSSVVCPLLRSPRTLPSSSTTALITGSPLPEPLKFAAGLVLPAVSRAVAVSPALPVCAGVIAMENVPSVATPEPIILPSASRIITVLPVSAVPVTVPPS